MENAKERYETLRRAIAGERLPLALVDLDAMEKNVDTLLAPLASSKKTLRLASKSIRSVALLRTILERGAARMRGIMAYSAEEALFLVEQGFSDILIAYPTAQWQDAQAIAEANRKKGRVSIAVDDLAHVDLLSRAGAEAGVTIPIVVDVDVSYRPFGESVHLGVRRSPLRDPGAIADFIEAACARPHLVLGGLLAYEAHIAGLSDGPQALDWKGAQARMFKRIARGAVVAQRAAIVAALGQRGIAIPLFNGGGSGSVAFSVADPSLTEVAAGSGFLDSHLFDHYEGLALLPAAFFALQVTRKPARGYWTCQGGGLIASGAAGPDRLPIPAFPQGLSLLPMEGAGEVQTPLHGPPGIALSLGDPVFFRHAKTGELATHFQEYALLRGDRIVGRAKTYRGEGRCFH